MRFLAAHKDVATVEVTPHHLTLAAPEAYERLGTLAQMNPPIRDEAPSRRHLATASAQGIVDVLGSDHAPHTLEEKARPYPESPSGMTGVQTLVPIMLDHVAAGRLTLRALRRPDQPGPGRVFGIAGKGRIAVGYDADLTIVDLKRHADDHERLDRLEVPAGRPMTASRVTGWPVGTVVRGHRVMWEGGLVEARPRRAGIASSRPSRGRIDRRPQATGMTLAPIAATSARGSTANTVLGVPAAAHT